VEILDKRSSGSGVEYQFELKPLWLSADLVKKAQMEHVHIRRYETGTKDTRRYIEGEKAKAKAFGSMSA